MGDISISGSAALVLRTWPFFLLRTVVYLGVAAAFAAAAGGGAGIGLGLGTLTSAAGRAPGAFWGAFAGLAFVAALLRWLREYFLYFVESSHAAAMALAPDHASLPSAQGRIAAVMTVLQRRFREIAGLVAAERLTRRTIGDLVGSTNPVSGLLPQAAKLPDSTTGIALRHSLGFVSEAVLGRTICGSARNVYADLQNSLVVLARHHAVLLRNALLLVGASFIVNLALFLLCLIPAALLTRSLPGGSIPVAVLLAGSFAWSLGRAFVRPLAVAAFLELYGRVGKGAPDPGWDSRLTATSEPYRKIKAAAAPASRGPRRGVVA